MLREFWKSQRRNEPAGRQLRLVAPAIGYKWAVNVTNESKYLYAPDKLFDAAE